MPLVKVELQRRRQPTRRPARSRHIGAPQHRRVPTPAPTGTERQFVRLAMLWLDRPDRSVPVWLTEAWASIRCREHAAAAVDFGPQILEAAKEQQFLPPGVEHIDRAARCPHGLWRPVWRQELPPTFSFDGRFDLATHTAEEWAQDWPLAWQAHFAEAGRTLHQLDKVQHDQIRVAILSQFGSPGSMQRHPAMIAILGELRRNPNHLDGYAYAMRGLNRPQVNAMAKQIERLVADAANPETGVIRPKRRERLDARITRLGESRRRYRAKMIARTETAAVTMAARQQETMGAINAGVLSGTHTVKEWVTTAYDSCPQCIALNATRAPVQGTFPGGFDAPPAHPNCRCDIALATVPGAPKQPTQSFVCRECYPSTRPAASPPQRSPAVSPTTAVVRDAMLQRLRSAARSDPGWDDIADRYDRFLDDLIDSRSVGRLDDVAAAQLQDAAETVARLADDHLATSVPRQIMDGLIDTVRTGDVPSNLTDPSRVAVAGQADWVTEARRAKAVMGDAPPSSDPVAATRPQLTRMTAEDRENTRRGYTRMYHGTTSENWQPHRSTHLTDSLPAADTYSEAGFSDVRAGSKDGWLHVVDVPDAEVRNAAEFDWAATDFTDAVRADRDTDYLRLMIPDIDGVDAVVYNDFVAQAEGQMRTFKPITVAAAKRVDHVDRFRNGWYVVDLEDGATVRRFAPGEKAAARAFADKIDGDVESAVEWYDGGGKWRSRSAPKGTPRHQIAGKKPDTGPAPKPAADAWPEPPPGAEAKLGFAVGDVVQNPRLSGVVTGIRKQGADFDVQLLVDGEVKVLNSKFAKLEAVAQVKSAPQQMSDAAAKAAEAAERTGQKGWQAVSKRIDETSELLAAQTAAKALDDVAAAHVHAVLEALGEAAELGLSHNVAQGVATGVKSAVTKADVSWLYRTHAQLPRDAPDWAKKLRTLTNRLNESKGLPKGTKLPLPATKTAADKAVETLTKAPGKYAQVAKNAAVIDATKSSLSAVDQAAVNDVLVLLARGVEADYSHHVMQGVATGVKSAIAKGDVSWLTRDITADSPDWAKKLRTLRNKVGGDTPPKVQPKVQPKAQPKAQPAPEPSPASVGDAAALWKTDPEAWEALPEARRLGLVDDYLERQFERVVEDLRVNHLWADADTAGYLGVDAVRDRLADELGSIELHRRLVETLESGGVSGWLTIGRRGVLRVGDVKVATAGGIDIGRDVAMPRIFVGDRFADAARRILADNGWEPSMRAVERRVDDVINRMHAHGDTLLDEARTLAGTGYSARRLREVTDELDELAKRISDGDAELIRLTDAARELEGAARDEVLVRVDVLHKDLNQMSQRRSTLLSERERLHGAAAGGRIAEIDAEAATLSQRLNELDEQGFAHFDAANRLDGAASDREYAEYKRLQAVRKQVADQRQELIRERKRVEAAAQLVDERTSIVQSRRRTVTSGQLDELAAEATARSDRRGATKAVHSRKTVTQVFGDPKAWETTPAAWMTRRLETAGEQAPINYARAKRAYSRAEGKRLQFAGSVVDGVNGNVLANRHSRTIALSGADESTATVRHEWGHQWQAEHPMHRMIDAAMQRRLLSRNRDARLGRHSYDTTHRVAVIEAFDDQEMKQEYTGKIYDWDSTAKHPSNAKSMTVGQWMDLAEDGAGDYQAAQYGLDELWAMTAEDLGDTLVKSANADQYRLSDELRAIWMSTLATL